MPMAGRGTSVRADYKGMLALKSCLYGASSHHRCGFT